MSSWKLPIPVDSRVSDVSSREEPTPCPDGDPIRDLIIPRFASIPIPLYFMLCRPTCSSDLYLVSSDSPSSMLHSSCCFELISCGGYYPFLVGIRACPAPIPLPASKKPYAQPALPHMSRRPFATQLPPNSKQPPIIRHQRSPVRNVGFSCSPRYRRNLSAGKSTDS